MEENKKPQATIRDLFEEASQAFEDQFKPVGLTKQLLDAFGGNDSGEEAEQASDTAKKTEYSEPKFHTYPIV